MYGNGELSIDEQGLFLEFLKVDQSFLQHHVRRLENQSRISVLEILDKNHIGRSFFHLCLRRKVLLPPSPVEHFSSAEHDVSVGQVTPHKAFYWIVRPARNRTRCQQK